VTYHIICFTDFNETVKGKIFMGYACMIVISINVCYGLFMLVKGMVHSTRLVLKRKAMLRKDKSLRQRFNKKYSPYAQRIILAAHKNGTTVQEELQNHSYRRISFIQKHLRHTRLAVALDAQESEPSQAAPSERQSSSSSSEGSSSSSSSSPRSGSGQEAKPVNVLLEYS
jgi:hypothetical protein